MQPLPLLRPSQALSALEVVVLCWRMTRPRVLALVVFTCLPVLALGGWPGTARALAILGATFLAGASASVLNAWLERDSDARMARTRGRPLPAEVLHPRFALAYGIVLGVASVAALAGVGGALAASLGLGSILFYVLVYTWWLKPRTPLNIVIGGAAGASAPLLADAALDGRLGLEGLLPFLLVLLWTPPHFWAVALYRKQDYAAARIPMLPLVVGDEATRRRMVAYVLVLIPVSLSVVVLPPLGLPYLLAAAGLGTWLLVEALRCLRRAAHRQDRWFFAVSNQYLLWLFAAMVLDGLL